MLNIKGKFIKEQDVYIVLSSHILFLSYKEENNYKMEKSVRGRWASDVIP